MIEFDNIRRLLNELWKKASPRQSASRLKILITHKKCVLKRHLSFGLYNARMTDTELTVEFRGGRGGR